MTVEEVANSSAVTVELRPLRQIPRQMASAYAERGRGVRMPDAAATGGVERAATGGAVRVAAGIGPGAARRALDTVVAATGLVICGLPLLALILAVRLSSRGPALFRQVRLGQGGRPFVFYKLRSMRAGSGGPEITTITDTRVTRLGRVLRSTSLDELPQLWHVLRGQMTLVGPRPETPALAARYPLECQWVFAHRPGLTGPAQVRMRDADVLGWADGGSEDAYLNLVVPARAAIEAPYLARPTLRATVAILADTVRHLLGARLPVR